MLKRNSPKDRPSQRVDAPEGGRSQTVSEYPAPRALLLRRAIAAVVLLTAPVLSISAGLQDSPWPMFHRNAEHTARSLAPFPMNAAVQWTKALTDSAEYASPAIGSDGTVYMADRGGHVFAVDPASGATLWDYSAGGNFRRSSPALADDGTLYIGSSDGNLYALNADGTQKWAAPTGADIKTHPAIGGDGTIYFGNDAGTLYALRPDGTTRWTFAAGDTIRSSPAIVGDTLVVFGSHDGGIYALRMDGTVAWNAFTGGPVKASPAVGQGGDIIVGSFDGFVYSLRHHGELSWATFVDRKVRASAAIGFQGKIYFAMDTDVVCFHDDGDTCWVYPTLGEVLSTPAVYTDLADTSETVVCGSDDGNLYAINDGSLIWSIPIGSAVRSSPAIGSSGQIYVGANDGNLYSLSEPTVAVPNQVPGSARLVLGPHPIRVGDDVTFRLQDAGLGAGKLDIFGPDGRKVRSMTLPDRGYHVWDGSDANGRSLPPGVYLYRWTTPSASGSGTMVRVR